MRFVIFHGSFSKNDEIWFPDLKNRLEKVGQEVILPQFPIDDWDEVTKNGPTVETKNQNLNNWIESFKGEILPKIKDEKICFIGHSIGPVFILHLVEKFNIKLDSAIFVAPFLDKLNKQWQIDLVNKTFYKSNFDFDRLTKLIPKSFVLHSDNDPYVDEKYSLDFAKKMGSSVISVKNAGHMSGGVNLNKFPLIYDLCCTRLDLEIYKEK